MRNASLLAVALLALPVTHSFANTATTTATAAPSGGDAAVDLFNGTDLSGWVDVNTSASTCTVAKDETGAPIIKCTGVPTGLLRT